MADWLIQEQIKENIGEFDPKTSLYSLYLEEQGALGLSEWVSIANIIFESETDWRMTGDWLFKLHQPNNKYLGLSSRYLQTILSLSISKCILGKTKKSSSPGSKPPGASGHINCKLLVTLAKLDMIYGPLQRKSMWVQKILVIVFCQPTRCKHSSDDFQDMHCKGWTNSNVVFLAKPCKWASLQTPKLVLKPF